MKLLSLTHRPGCRSPRDGSAVPGMTLLELTVVMLVLLTMVVLLFISGRAWKRGSDRALCLVNLETTQKAVRSFSNLNGYNPNESVSGLEGEVIGPGKFLESLPKCPGFGTYTTLGDQIPGLGTLYMQCSLAGSLDHEPPDPTGW